MTAAAGTLPVTAGTKSAAQCTQVNRSVNIMSDREKEVAPGDLQEDLELSTSSGEEEASEAGGTEVAME